MPVRLLESETWIDLILRRGGELRKAGVLSIGVDGCSVVLAPAEPDIDAGDEASAPVDEESPNPWENPASYPTGQVPSLGDVEPADKMPPIPSFGDH